MRRLVALAVVALAVAPAAAEAASVRVGDAPGHRFFSWSSYGGPTVYYDAAPGERNRLLVSYAGDAETVTVRDPGAVIQAGAGCASINAHRARCGPNTSHIQHTEARLGDRDDQVRTFRPTPYPIGGVAAFGGPGDDVLDGGEGSDELFGGRGGDRLLGGVGNDVLVDGTRAAEADVMDGGAERDLVSYAARRRGVTVDLADPGRRAGARGEDAISNFEAAFGGAGPDRLYGNDASNLLRGNGGADRLYGRFGDDGLEGGGGPDRLRGSAGDDALRGNRGRDWFSCGFGADTVYGPVPGELLRPHCNRVDFLRSLDRHGNRQLNLRAQPLAVSRRAVSFQMRCPTFRDLEFFEFDPCSVTVELRARSGRLLGRAHYEQESAGDPERVRIRLNRRGRRLVRRRGGVIASLSIPDFEPARIGWAVRLKR